MGFELVPQLQSAHIERGQVQENKIGVSEVWRRASAVVAASRTWNPDFLSIWL